MILLGLGRGLEMEAVRILSGLGLNLGIPRLVMKAHI